MFEDVGLTELAILGGRALLAFSSQQAPDTMLPPLDVPPDAGDADAAYYTDWIM